MTFRLKPVCWSRLSQEVESIEQFASAAPDNRMSPMRGEEWVM